MGIGGWEVRQTRQQPTTLHQVGGMGWQSRQFHRLGIQASLQSLDRPAHINNKFHNFSEEKKIYGSSTHNTKPPQFDSKIRGSATLTNSCR